MTLVIPSKPDKVDVKKDGTVVVTWYKSPSVHGETIFEVTVTKDGSMFVRGLGGSEHALQEAYADLIAKLIRRGLSPEEAVEEAYERIRPLIEKARAGEVITMLDIERAREA